jgi:hypothetical protein
MTMTTTQATQPVSIRPSASPLSEVLAYNNPDVIDRISREHQMPMEAAASVFRDTVRFLYLAGATDARHIAPTKNIDKGWHAFLMFTRDYADFCQTYFGRFIHHEPRRRGDAAPKVNHLAVTFDLARQFFGPSLSDNWSYDIHAIADCQKCTSQCSPDTGGGGNECTPDGGD